MPGVPPVPIPNTAVKPRAADGSRTLGPARVGRCQVYSPEQAKARSGLLLFICKRPAEALQVGSGGPGIVIQNVTISISDDDCFLCPALDAAAQAVDVSAVLGGRPVGLAAAGRCLPRWLSWASGRARRLGRPNGPLL